MSGKLIGLARREYVLSLVTELGGRSALDVWSVKELRSKAAPLFPASKGSKLVLASRLAEVMKEYEGFSTGASLEVMAIAEAMSETELTDTLLRLEQDKLKDATFQETWLDASENVYQELRKLRTVTSHQDLLYRVNAIAGMEMGREKSVFTDGTVRTRWTSIKKFLLGRPTDEKSAIMKEHMGLVVDMYCEAYGKGMFDVSRRVNEDYRVKIVEKVSNQKFMDAEVVLPEMYRLLNSLSWVDMAVGLMLACGRRPAEVMCTADFVTTGSSDTVLFTGQLKTKTRTDVEAIEIPVLCGSELFMLVWERFIDTRPIIDLETYKKVDKYRKTVTRDMEKNKNLVSYDGNKKIPSSPKCCRLFYAAYCIENLKPNGMSANAFASQILGHGENDVNTANSYQQFTTLR